MRWNTEQIFPQVPLSTRALIQRINRQLKHEDRTLKITRGQRARLDLGDYYILNTARNWIASGSTLGKSYGRELGVIEPYEYVTED